MTDSKAPVIPWDVAIRVGLLFVALCAIKLAMLFGFRVHLFEIHWRVDLALTSTWLNRPVFFLFAILVALNLWLLGERCAASGLSTVRAANACVLVLGASFIFLTFCTGKKIYFCSLLDGTATWRGLAAGFFSKQTCWSAWLLIYAMFYCVLVRLRAEHRILRVTAIVAAVYILLILRYMLNCREALLAADCVGVACLFAGTNFKNSLPWPWLVLTCMWTPFLILIFLSQHVIMMTLGKPFLALSGGVLAILTATSIFAWRRKFYPAWSWLLPFAFASCLLLVNANYNYSANYQGGLTLGLMLPRYFLGEFALVAALLALGTIYRRFLPSGSLLWLDAINLLLIAFALADLRLSQIMGIRLDWQALKISGDFKMMMRQAEPYLPDLAFGLVMLASLYAILTGFLKRAAPGKTVQIGRGGWFFAAAFLLLGITGYWTVDHDKAEGESAVLLAKSSPWFNWTSAPLMDEKSFVTNSRQLGLEQMLVPPTAIPVRPQRDLNVVLIFQESSYNKYLSLFNGRDDTQPLLSKYKNRMEIFPNFFSSFQASVNARFATLSGLYPVRDYEAFTFHRVGVKSIFEILSNNGYTCSLFDSASFDYTDFRDFLRGRGINTTYDADTMPGKTGDNQVTWGINETVTLKAIQSQIRQYAANHQKFFISYFPVAPHNPFDGIPSQFQKFPPVKKDGFVPQYENELLYLDWVISSIIDELKNSGILDHTLIIITDDHGEMLGENGGPIGHGWAITPALINIPLIIMDPGNPGYRINDTIGSQVDLLPTILDLLGIPLPSDQLYQGTSLYSSLAQKDRTIYLNSFQQYAIIQDHRLLCGDREVKTSNGTNNLSFKFYTITNDGARTVFSKTDSPDVLPPTMTQFDTFQENFIQNYADYSRRERAPFPAGN